MLTFSFYNTLFSFIYAIYLKMFIFKINIQCLKKGDANYKRNLKYFQNQKTIFPCYSKQLMFISNVQIVLCYIMWGGYFKAWTSTLLAMVTYSYSQCISESSVLSQTSEVCHPLGSWILFHLWQLFRVLLHFLSFDSCIHKTSPSSWSLFYV